MLLYLICAQNHYIDIVSLAEVDLCVVKLRFFAVSETKARVAWSAAVKQILYWLVSARLSQKKWGS